MSDRASSQRWFILALFALATGLVVHVVAPFAGAFFAATVLAGALSPWQRWLTRKLGGRRNLAAGCLTFGIIAAIAAPLVFVAVSATEEAAEVVDWITTTVEEDGIDGLVDALPEPARDPAKAAIQKIPEHSQLGRLLNTSSDLAEAPSPSNASAESLPLESVIPRLGGAVSFVQDLATGLFDLVLQLSVTILAMFFLLSQGHSLVGYLVELAPLGKEQTLSILNRLHHVNTALLTSTVVTAILQSLVALIGYLITGISSLALLTIVTFLCALIPVVGAATVTVGAGAILWMSGETGFGLFLILWGVIPVSLTDNIVKPFLARKDAQMPGSLLFFAMVCGIAVFGPMGVVAGPLVIAFFQVVAEAVRERAT